MKNKSIRVLTYVVPFIIIMFLVLFHIKENCYPKIFGDEYGYWATGAFFAGIDWTDITSLNEYYGWGYGFPLSFILRLNIDAKTCYTLAIILNGVLICGIYCISYKVAIILFPQKNRLFRSLVSLVATFLPTTLYYSQYTMSELPLCFLYWCLIFVELNIQKRVTLVRLSLLFLVDAALFATHFRTVGIVVVSILYALYCIYISDEKLKIKLFLIYVAEIICGLSLVLFVKNQFKASLVSQYSSGHNANTIDGNVSKIVTLFSLDGLKAFIHNFFGRLCSLFTSTSLIGGFVLLFFIAILIRKVHAKEKLGLEDSWALVCILNTLSLIAISAVYMIRSVNSRLDILTYSRYHDFSVGILIMLGFFYLSNLKIMHFGNKNILLTILAGVLLTIDVADHIDYESTMSHLFINIPSSFYWYKMGESKVGLFEGMLLVSVLTFILVVILINIKEIGPIIACIVLLLWNIYQYNYVFEEGCLKWFVTQEEQNTELCNFILDNDYEDSVYFLNDDDVLKIEAIQFMLKDYPIHVITEQQLSDLHESECLLILTKNYEMDLSLEDDYQKVMETKALKVWKIME